MKVLKKYITENDIDKGKVNIGAITRDIKNSGLVVNYVGLNSAKDGSWFEVLGDSITASNLVALGLLVEDHIHETTQQKIKKGYKPHEKEGKAFSDNYRADTLIKVLSETISEDDAIELDIILALVDFKLSTGNWKTAKRMLENMIVGTVFTQEIKDELVSDFSDYIADNYA